MNYVVEFGGNIPYNKKYYEQLETALETLTKHFGVIPPNPNEDRIVIYETKTESVVWHFSGRNYPPLDIPQGKLPNRKRSLFEEAIAYDQEF